MADAITNAFEIERRGIVWHKDNTLDDGITSLLWNDDPNNVVNGNTPGESKLYTVLPGSQYYENLTPGDTSYALWLKTALPNTWEKVSAGAADDTAALVFTFGCEVAAAVGDIVQHSTTIGTFVDVTPDNLQAKPAIGILLEKITSTLCKVLLFGIYQGPGFTGLTVGGKVYVGPTGEGTSTKPTSGYEQVIGEAITSSILIVKPETNRVNQL